MQCSSPMDFGKKYEEVKPSCIKIESNCVKLQEVVQNLLAILKNTNMRSNKK